MSAAQRDHYAVLGVERTADEGEIKRAYRKLAIQFHPDRNPDDPAAERSFQEATRAYEILSDAEKRRRYDRFGHAAFEQAGHSGATAGDVGAVGEILEGLFGEVFGGRRKKTRGARDLTYELEVSFVEAATGAAKPIEVKRPMPCGTCDGKGAKPGTPMPACEACGGRGDVKSQRGFFSATRPCQACGGRGFRIETGCEDCKGQGQREVSEKMTVKVPAGVADGAVRTVRGGGEVTAKARGDLHVTIRVAEHPLFTREGPDVLCEVPISFPQAALGAQVEIPTLEGKVKMKVPPGTQSGKVFRLRGKGIAIFGGAGKGDQLVTVTVEVPETLTRTQRRLIGELGSALDGDDAIASQPRRQGFVRALRGLFE